MKKIILRCDDDGGEKFRNDDRVSGITKLLFSLLLYDNDNKLFSKIARIIHKTYTLEELVFKAGKIFDDKNYLTMKKCWNPLCSIYADKEHIGNLRGAILEKLVYMLLDKKYRNCDSGMGCTVIIGPYTSKHTVDVIFSPLTDDNGESYECKVDPFNIDKHDIDNLREIFFKSNKRIYPKIASFSDTRAIEWRLKQLAVTMTVGSLNLFGCENLKETLM